MTLNYIGSKKKLLPFLDYVISSNVEGKGSFGDLFAGTGIVGKYFSDKGYSIIGNDTEWYSYVINYASLKCSYSTGIQEIINSFNQLKGISGLIYKNYTKKGGRLFFTEDNGMKADAIRLKINELLNEKKINQDDYYFLLASLLQSLDKMANTTSVYGAFLKKMKKNASKPLVIKPIHKNFLREVNKNRVIRKNILEIELDRKLDIIYLDPPYVARQYGANYCPLNYLVEYDEKIKLRGKSGLYNYYKSPFASKTKAKNAFIKMFQKITHISDNIFLSYNNQGILTSDEIKDIMKKYGDVTIYVYDYKKFQSVKKKGGRTKEYIYFLKCSQDVGKIKIINLENDENNNIKISNN